MNFIIVLIRAWKYKDSAHLGSFFHSRKESVICGNVFKVIRSAVDCLSFILFANLN